MPPPVRPTRHRAPRRSPRRQGPGRGRPGPVGLSLLLLLGAASVASGAPALDPRQEARLLMDQGIELARGAIRSGSELRPFAFVMRPDGKVIRLVPNKAQKSVPPGQLVAVLEQGLRQQASSGELRATALFVDVVITRDGIESDAIQARLEHASGYCVDVFYAYRLLEDGEPRFEEPVTTPRRGSIFASCGAGPAGAGDAPAGAGDAPAGAGDLPAGAGDAPAAE